MIPGPPIGCPFLRAYAEEADAIPAKCRKASGAPPGGMELNHWMERLLELAQKATDCPSREGGEKRKGRYEVTRKRALQVIWGAYATLQAMADDMPSGRYEVSESHFEIHQRNREGIVITTRDVEEL
mgnify:CR=1 FL=1|tara:strand:- start:1929 stop:2309 length:381 start_codon:yes stop_codon:yes gene_type:complete